MIGVNSGKTVLITGASSGIGYATALMFAERGWHVIACSRTGDGHPLHAAIRGCKMDVALPSSVEECFEMFKKEQLMIDVIVNNAAVLLRLPHAMMTEADTLDMFQTNVLGPIRIARGWHACNGKGVLINVGSLAGYMGMLYHSTYCATKHALAGWSEALSYELEARGVTVKIVDPLSRVDTLFTDKAAKEEQRRMTPVEEKHFQAYSASIKKSHSLLSAQQVAEVIWRAATDGKKTLHYTVCSSIAMRVMYALYRVAPGVVHRFMMKRYARLSA